jgi:hypothetical protein
MRKTLGTIITATLLLSLLVPSLISVANASDPADWYMTVPGVLDTDTYSLYPYNAKSLNIGFSKFGEMLNTLDNTGLEYGTVDPFAPPAGSAVGAINKEAWLQGWLINITYVHRIRGEMRVVWATAQHADAVAYGGDWIRVDFANDWSPTYGVEDPRDPGYWQNNYAAGAMNHGGRKTNGTAVTEPMQVLYDGPRKFVGLVKTTIYDHFTHETESTTEDIPLVELQITIVFNKVKKEVILYKDLKTLVHEKYSDEMKVQFSNRGEVDLGDESSGYTSYFHFYTQGTDVLGNDTLVEGLPTVYNDDWVLDVTQDPETTFWANYSAAGPYPQSSSATLDLATAINPTAGKAWFAAFWPSLSDSTIDGWPMWWRSMTALDPHDIDASSWGPAPRAEPSIPYYIGEWDCEMLPVGRTSHQAFRFVTVYGVTDLWNGNDANMGGGNVIDDEVMYQVDEVFNPWDLEQAVHKDTMRHVWIDDVSAITYVTLPEDPFLWSDWDAYCMFSERVLLDGELLVPLRSGRSNWDYQVTYDSMGYPTIWFRYVTTGHLKVLYSTYTEYTNMGSVDFSWTDYNVTMQEMIGGWTVNEVYTESNTDPLGATHTLDVEELILTVDLAEGVELMDNMTWTFMGTMDVYEEDFKVFKEGDYTLSAYWWDQSGPHGGRVFNHNETQGDMSFYFGNFWMFWMISPPEGLDLHVDWLHLDVDYTVTVEYSTLTGNFTVTTAFEVNGHGGNNLPHTAGNWGDALYVEHIPGRYEWVVVGRDSAAVDSAGSALVAAAFKNKQVEIGLAGTDMMYPELANQIPWVMSKIGDGDAVTDYHYDHAGGDHRTALKDDWCTTWPIASSNMIGVGGPLANVLAWYGNDFTNAFYGLDAFTDWTWENKVAALSCWNKNSYMSSEATGYAVVSTYKDINGTVLFLVWGNWGRDTYYTTKWFHEEGIFQLQDAPSGLTDIILKIGYTDPEHPTFTIVECLSTISETEWYHGYTKGGIHDP